MKFAVANTRKGLEFWVDWLKSALSKTGTAEAPTKGETSARTDWTAPGTSRKNIHAPAAEAKPRNLEILGNFVMAAVPDFVGWTCMPIPNLITVNSTILSQ